MEKTLKTPDAFFPQHLDEYKKYSNLYMPLDLNTSLKVCH